MTTRLRPTKVVQILKMARNGSPVSVIALAAGVEPDKVEEVARAHGWPDSSATLDAAIRDLMAGRSPRQRREVQWEPARPTPAPPASAQADEDSLDALLKAAKEMGRADFRRRVDLIERTAAKLRADVEAYRERNDQVAKVKRLQQQAAEAAALAGIPDRGGDQLIREWAKKQHMAVNRTGTLPKKVRDAYVTAHAKKGAAK